MPSDHPLSAKVALQLRLPRGLHQRLAIAAKRNGNSLNGEIVRRLEAVENRQEMLRGFVALLLRFGELADGQAATRTASQNGGALSEREIEAGT